MHADWCLLLARTDADARKRKGISYFLMDMATPGIDVRPIRNAVGDSHFCEMFLTDVAIPADHLVGAEDAGWQVAQATLGAERGMTMLELAERLGDAGFRRLVEECARPRPDGSGARAAQGAGALVTSEFTELHDELRAVARDLLGRTGTDVGWKQIAGAGWTGLEIPEPLGGAGVVRRVRYVLKELGRAATGRPIWVPCWPSAR